ncbi:MAG: hypothetical protein EOO62_32820, partial [Hymenobacter sp.]
MSEPAFLDAAVLARENEELRQQLREAEELIVAVRTGAIDALAIQGADGPRIFTLEGADQSYRMLVEQMNEGALLLSPVAIQHRAIGAQQQGALVHLLYQHPVALV